MIEFEDPATGQRERVSWRSAAWTFIFGAFYFALKGAWLHAALLLMLLGLPLWRWGLAGWPIAVLAWLGYVALTPVLLARHYRARGWRARERLGPPARD